MTADASSHPFKPSVNETNFPLRLTATIKSEAVKNLDLNLTFKGSPMKAPEQPTQESTPLASNVYVIASTNQLLLGGEKAEEARVVIDLGTGEVKSRMALDEASLEFWKSVNRFAKTSIGEGARCSCKCGCNRKLATHEFHRMECAPCDVGLHKKEAKDG